jgi:hypothetical protein
MFSINADDLNFCVSFATGNESFLLLGVEGSHFSTEWVKAIEVLPDKHAHGRTATWAAVTL